MTALRGRTALVTGAGRGIGRAIAVALAQAGVARLALVARSEAQLEESAAEVVRAGAEPLPASFDLGRTAELRGFATALAERLGGVDILVNNAGTVAPLGPTPRLDPAEVDLAFRINVLAPIVLCGALVPGMTERGWGRIVNVSSGAAANAARAVGSAVYAATKSALEAHTLGLAAELAGSGVTVNAYRPGIVDTSMQRWVREQDPDRIGRELHERFVSHHESGELLAPEHSAGVLVRRLAGDATGEVWRVEEG